MSDEKKEFVKHEIPRPEFPKRAIITGGMPYGNKKLHFGHIGGVFVFADVYARFLRDRLGDENVIFVSGTDCYLAPGRPPPPLRARSPPRSATTRKPAASLTADRSSANARWTAAAAKRLTLTSATSDISTCRRTSSTPRAPSPGTPPL